MPKCSGIGAQVPVAWHPYARLRDALAVYFPGWAPDLALIELPGDVGCVPVPRRRVTDLLEFQGSEAQLDDGDGGDEDPPDDDDRD